MSASGSGHPRRVLIAEDQCLLAMVITDFVRDAGYEPVGPVASVEQAQSLIEANGLHGALLDVRLADGLVIGVAERLERMGVPFIFMTANPEEVEHRFDAPVLHKPYDFAELSRRMRALFHDEPGASEEPKRAGDAPQG